MAYPALHPCRNRKAPKVGEYRFDGAEAALRSAGVYDAVKSKLVLGESVSQALQFVQSGAADAGVVALSLALSPTVGAQGRYAIVPVDSYPRMEQGGVVLRAAADTGAAMALRAFILDAPARAVLKRFGFYLPAA